MKRIISAIQPTNRLTLGNYIGAIAPLIKLQDKYEIILFVADLHAMSVPYDHKILFKNKQGIVASYLACGLDLNKNTIFYQSSVSQHTELSWVLTCHCTFGELSRMTQFKDKSAKFKLANGTQTIPCGLFLYPVLMAADILLYKAEYVVVGADQKQHVELCRDIAERFNKKYGETFTICEPMIVKTGGRIMDLLNPTIKMSKSNTNENGTVFLLDQPEIAAKKIMGAKTDSLNIVKYDVENQPAISNLLTIYSSLTNKSIEEIVKQYVNKTYGALKKDLAEIIKQFLTQFQNKYQQTLNDFASVEKQLLNNANKCQKMANDVLSDVYKKIGISK